MKEDSVAARERIPLLATNLMRIAGIQGVYGDPCGIDIFPVTLDEALREEGEELLLIDADSGQPLFEILGKFRERRPLARLVVVGVDQDDTYIECVISAGARGFLGANAIPEEFRCALYDVREGSIWATRKVLSRLAESQLLRRLPERVDQTVKFTSRERQIIGLLLAGNANREISENLGIEPVTVKAHLGRIMRKAGVVNRIELTMFAVKHRSLGSRQNRAL